MKKKKNWILDIAVFVCGCFFNKDSLVPFSTLFIFLSLLPFDLFKHPFCALLLCFCVEIDIMELGLSLGGDASRSPLQQQQQQVCNKMNNDKGLGFCMGLGMVDLIHPTRQEEGEKGENDQRVSVDPPLLQLDLLPLVPVPRNHKSGFPLQENGTSEAGSSGQVGGSGRGFDVNRPPSTEKVDDGAAVSSPNSTVSSFQIDFSIYANGSGGGNKRDAEMAELNDVDAERASSRASDEDENGLTRKKLRLSKEQSAYLEESFKEHNTLNPKQKLGLAKQLNLRPRQVEVWFQNRRARTKLKQTEVDCEYLKRCCETLTEENRRLQKELQELRTLKTSHPFYMQLPATTLTMCPSCERVATTTTTTNPSAPASASADNSTTTTNTPKATTFSLTKPRFYPFLNAQVHAHAS